VRYALTEKAFTALLALSRRDQMSLLAAFEQICENPVDLATGSAVDWEGQLTYAVRHGRYEIAYIVSRDSDWMTITLIRPKIR
jgi:hypothetical protein